MLLLLDDPALTRFFHALQVERCQSYYCRPLLFVPLVGLLKRLFVFCCFIKILLQFLLLEMDSILMSLN